MSPLPSCPSPPFWLFCGSSAPWRPPPQTTDTKRRAAKLGLILVCAGSEWVAYCEKPSRACMEMPGRPFTRGPCPGQPCSAHPPPHPEWCAPIAPPLLCWHSTTFCTFQPSSDSWERIVRLFGRLINFDKQLTECNPGSASLSHPIQIRLISRTLNKKIGRKDDLLYTSAITFRTPFNQHQDLHRLYSMEGGSQNKKGIEKKQLGKVDQDEQGWMVIGVSRTETKGSQGRQNWARKNKWKQNMRKGSREQEGEKGDKMMEKEMKAEDAMRSRREQGRVNDRRKSR